MIWKKTDSSTKLGVAIYNFKQPGEHRLFLDIGDTVHILEETDAWFRGFVVKDKSKKGIFPRNYISIKDATVHVSGTHETVSSREHPLVIELTSVLREWHAIWKQMFVERNPDIGLVQEMIEDLLAWRKKILARIYTVDELRESQKTVTALIDKGNTLLKLDLVVRDGEGNVLDPAKSSIVEIYKQHVEAAERLQAETHKRDSDIDRRPNGPQSFNLCVMLKNFVCKIGEDSDIMMNLFDAKEERFISENYLVKWGKQGVPKDIDMLNKFRVVFTDLGTKDRDRSKVYLVFQIVRIGVMDPKNVENKRQTQGIRRPFGVAALDVTDLMRGTQSSHEEKELFVPFLACNDEFMINVIKKVISAKEINHRGQGLWVALKILHGDLKQVRENYPHLVLPGTTMARKMGFPDVIMPGDVRNDIYLTIMQGDFNKGPTKSSDKNVEVSMCVCDAKGNVLEDVISYGCVDQAAISEMSTISIGQALAEYKSLVYYHQDRPKWFETIKVAISPEVDFVGLHLKFIFRHKSSTEAKDRTEKPFAMSFVRLLNDNGTTLADQVHELLVYKIESKKPEDASLYLKLPCNKQELEAHPASLHGQKQAGGLSLSSRDTFSVYSYVCSTKLTHNVDLLGLLKWQDVLNDSKSLRKYLEHLMREEGEEIVKFLQDLLDSLFNILMQNDRGEVYENLVFDALIYIITLIMDRKYHQFRPVLDAYIDTAFSFAMVYNKLVVILKDYVDKADECSTTSESQLLKAIKSIEYVFKFIIRSRCLFSMLNEGRGKQQFEISLKQLFVAINNMMVYKTANTLPVQGTALKFMPLVIKDVMTVFDPVELSHLLVQFLHNIPPERLVKQKMKCIDQIIQTDLFTLPQCRQVLLPPFLQQTHDLMEQKIEEMEECISVLGHIMDRLWYCDSSRDLDITILVNKILRRVIQSVIVLDQSHKQLGNCVCVMISLLRQMTDMHYRAYIQSFPTTFDLMDFLLEILCVFIDLVQRNVYPSDWLEMIMVQNCVILRALRFFAATINEYFSSPFEQQLWNNFFHCAISFLTQDSLQLDRFSISKRSKIVSRYKDMRRETGFEIRSMWFKLGPNKIKFIPQLVGPILEMTLIPEIELRKATIPIFFDMMHHEFIQPIPHSNHIQGNFNEFENEMVTKLDTLIEAGRGDEEYMELFTEILDHLCEGNETLCDQGHSFVDMIHDLLERLLAYRTIMADDVREHRMSCIVNLLDFYHDIGRQEMYIRYLHKLYDLHLGCDNYTEAAYTLILYTRLLQWSDEQLAPMLRDSDYKGCSTHRELKEELYYEILSNFDKGKMWEKGIELCEELCTQYKKETFDYVKLSKILKRQAYFYDCIMSKRPEPEYLRPEPEYFRVGYFGTGFPSFLQNKVFIHRGQEYERLGAFNARMQTLFPNAKLMKTLDPPSQDIMDSQKQYLQINNVSPLMELKGRFSNKDVEEQILKYYKVNEVQQFVFSRRKEDGSGDVTKMWLERTYMTTSYPLPGIVGWYPVVQVKTTLVSPMENAIETIEEKNKSVMSLIEQHRQDSGMPLNPLSLLLSGVVDPAVSGGIANYKEFYLGEYEQSLQDKLRDATINQVSLVRDALLIHKSKISKDMTGFQEHLEGRFTQMCAMIEREYGLKVADKGHLGTTLRRNQSLPSSSSMRVSDLSVVSLAVNPEPSESFAASSSATPRGSIQSTRSQSVWVKDKSSNSNSNNSSGVGASGDGGGGAKEKSSGSTLSLSKVSTLSTLRKRVSQVTEQFGSNSDLSMRNSLESPQPQQPQHNPIELSEQLTPKRPLRPEVEQRRPSRPPSSHSQVSLASSANSVSSSLSGGTLPSRNSIDVGEELSNGLTASTPETPPPLPEKHHSYGDIMMGVAAEVMPRRVSSVSQAGNRQKPPPPPPPPLIPDMDDDVPPPVPPKPHH